ncbi:MAG: hypothetical protein U0T32_12140 [Chitinophagales bacterium]
MAIAHQQLWPRPEPPKKPTDTNNMNSANETIDKVVAILTAAKKQLDQDAFTKVYGGYIPFDKVDTLNPPPGTKARCTAFNFFNSNPFKPHSENMEQPLKLTLQKAKEMYPSASDAFKTLLEENFGKKAFAKDIIDRLDDFKDVLAYHGITEQKFNDDTFDLEYDEMCYKALKLIVAAYNEGWTPNWKNSNEKKWQPVFDMSHSSGFGFSRTDYHYRYAAARVGSRLCFKEERLLLDAVKKFEKYYRGHYVIEK